MPPMISNRLLWLIVIAGLSGAYHIIPDLLVHVKTLAIAPAPSAPPPQKRLQKDSENALTIDTLRTLADGSSHDLRTSAIKIVASRSVRSRTRELLLRDLRSKDYDHRDKAINGLWMLLYHHSLSDTRIALEFLDKKTFKAIVDALINVLPLHDEAAGAAPKPAADPGMHAKALRDFTERNIRQAARKYGGDRSKLTPTELTHARAQAERNAADYVRRKTGTAGASSNPETSPNNADPLPPSPLRPPHRPAHEVSLLILLANLLRQPTRSRITSTPSAVECALSAGLVRRWLVVYPFPCAQPGNEKFGFKRSDVASLFDGKAWFGDDAVMADVVLQVLSWPQGRREMREVGLLGSRWKEDVDRELLWSEEWEAADDDQRNSPDRDVRMVNGEDTAGESGGGGTGLEEGVWEVVVGEEARRPERSREEEDLRRRHRQAVVLAENTGEPYILQPPRVRSTMGGAGRRRSPGRATEHHHDLEEVEARVTLSQNRAGELVIEAEGINRPLRHHEVQAIMESSLMVPQVRSVISGVVRQADLRRVHVRGGEQQGITGVEPEVGGGDHDGGGDNDDRESDFEL